MSFYKSIVSLFFIITVVFFLPYVSSGARIAGEDKPVTIPDTSKTPEPPLGSPEKKEVSKPQKEPSKDIKTPSITAQPAKAPEPPKPSEAPKLPVAGAPLLPRPPEKKEISLPAPGGLLPPGVQQLQEAKKPLSVKDTRYITIDFDNVDIQVFVKFISELVGKNFVIDDKVKGKKVTIISPKKIAINEAYKVFESVLDVYGFTAVPAGDVIKIIPSQDAKEKNIETRLKEEAISPEDKIVTQIIALEYSNPDDMKKVLDPLVSKASIILSYPPTGMLVITDVLSNIKRLQKIVTALDVEGVGEEISYLRLKFASATEVAKSLTALFQKQKGTIAPIKIVADERTNALILSATENDTVKVRELISMMDTGITKGDSLLHVYRLQNANAEDLAKVLMNIPKDAKAAGPPGKAVLSKDVSILADKATNTLIITAERADYIIIESVIKQLDVLRPMVYIEALIMEVSTNKDFRLGVEWRGIHDYTGSNIPGVPAGAPAAGIVGSGGIAAGTGGGLAGGYNIIPSVDAMTKAVSFPTGFAVGLLSGGISIGGVVFPTIGAVLQTYQYDSDVSILATPQIMTLDNEEAEINVGKTVPYITRSDTSSVTSTTTAVYGTSYEYKDVSTVLKITPHINDDQFVRLKIDQQVTKLDAQSQAGTPTTLKRAAKTTVVVKDNETVVIGGLIDESSGTSIYKVPLLGDIPILGWLFKSLVTTREKTNLFVFITPHIIRTQADASDMFKKKIGDAGVVEDGVIKLYDKKDRDKKDRKKAEIKEAPVNKE
jgi:general secretion pathway protein D